MLAKPGKNFQVMESQTVTPVVFARDGLVRAVLALGKSTRRRFFLHDGLGIGRNLQWACESQIRGRCEEQWEFW